MNWNHKAVKILITGKSGSGKTTLWLAKLRDSGARWKFVFDPDLEVVRRLRWPWCNSVEGLTQAVSRGLPVCYCPAAMFPGQRPQGFAFFCRWVWAVSEHLRGPKLLAVDEVWRYVPAGRPVPESFQIILDEGRKMEIDLLMIAQRPNRVHDAIRAQLTELCTFHHSDVLPLKWLKDEFDVEQVRRLKYPGGYISKDLIGGDAPKTHSAGKGNCAAAAPSREAGHDGGGPGH